MATIGFSNVGLQGFASKVLADGHKANAKERKFEDVVKSAGLAAVLALVY